MKVNGRTVGCTKQAILLCQLYVRSRKYCDGPFSHFVTHFLCASSSVVHREFINRRERAAEKARGGRHNNQTEQKEAQAHTTAAHVPTAQGKLSI